MAFNRDYADDGRSGGGFRAAGGSSLIDRDSFFNGVFKSSRDIRVEGECEGEIQCGGTVTIAAHARVSGTVNAENVAVSGVLEGEVECSGRFEILATGQVAARVQAGTVVVREGAFYEGVLRMSVEPEGLPAREVTSADGGMVRSAAATPATAGDAEEPTDIRSATNGRAGEPRPIRAGADS